MKGNEIGGHFTADLILIKRRNQRDVFFYIIAEQLNQSLPFFFIQLFQKQDSLIRIHFGKNGYFLFNIHLFQVARNGAFFGILDNIRQIVNIKNPIKALPFGNTHI